MATERAAPPAAYSPQLDGLRAVAVAAVAWSHWLPGWQFGVPLGAGVHLFFVLSGFLITRILLDLRTVPDRGAAIGRFYARRALRLFPAFYLVLAVVVVADVALARATWPWHAAYLSNVVIARQGEWPGFLSHFWSLAVEEQFYLLWPWLIVIAPARWLGPLLGAVVLTGPLARWVAASRGVEEPFWALVPGGSADSLGLGAWLAWGWWQRPDRQPTAARGWPAAGGLAFWLALAVAERFVTAAPAVAAWRQTAQGLVFAWVVAGAARGFGGAGGAVLAQPAIRAVGRVSYGAYLIHNFAPAALLATTRWIGADALVPSAPAARAVLYAATTLALAALMWRLIETPFLRLKRRVPYAGGGH